MTNTATVLLCVFVLLMLTLMGIASRCSAFNMGPVPFCLRARMGISSTVIVTSTPKPKFTSRQLAAKAKAKATDESSNPKSWFEDTEPFVVVRYYARKEITDNEIRAVLTENSITTLKELKNKTKFIAFLLEDDITDLVEALLAAINRPRQTPDEKLGGQYIFDDRCVPQSSLILYTEKAVSVFPKKKPMDLNDRMFDFTLVLGGSGSGKTVFALMSLASLLYDGTTKTCFRVHFQAKDVVMKKGSSSDMDRFADGVASIVKDKINIKLAELELDHVKKINLYLHVIMDEAGPDAYKGFFEKAENIQKIRNAIKTQMPCKFQRGVHLTLAGTGLEVTTKDIISMVETVKYRMKPWTMANFEALVTESKQPGSDDITNIVSNFPILQDLVTNARCAFYLLRVLKRVWFLGKNRQQNLAKVLVATVAERYIESSGLRKLGSAEEKWDIARSVFQELDKASSQRGVPFLPTFEGLANTTQRITARSLIETNVESSEGQLVFANVSDPFAVSMSPALAIVMANLLNMEADITWDWQGFESTVMLSELKHTVVQAQRRPNSLGRLVLELRAPLPSSSTTYSVPKVGDSTVILNGPKAAYADVIAPFRLVQAKFSTDDSKPKSLYITEELSKMGLLKDTSEHLIQQYLTQHLYDMWNEAAEIPNPVVNAATQSVNKKYRYQCYPYNTLNAKRMSEEPIVTEGKLFVDQPIKRDGLLEKETFMTVAGTRIDPSVINRVFDKKRPITAVFATNANSFRLPSMDFTIEPDDVDWNGKLITKVLPDEVISHLRENVEIRFLFF